MAKVAVMVEDLSMDTKLDSFGITPHLVTAYRRLSLAYHDAHEPTLPHAS